MPRPELGPKQITDQEVYDYAEGLLICWDFDKAEQRDTALFSFHFCQWLLETYGIEQENTWYLATHDEIDGQEVPSRLHGLLLYESSDGRRLTGNNQIKIGNHVTYIDNEPETSRTDESSKFSSRHVRHSTPQPDPEVPDIPQAKNQLIPEVSIVFEPDYTERWGLEILLNDTTLKLAPFGAEGHTWNALDFVQEHAENPGFIAELACRLTLLAVKNAYWYNDPSNQDQSLKSHDVLDKFFRRYHKIEETPLSLNGYIALPGNAAKYLVTKVMKDEK